MFNLEQSIADWRKQMLAAGVKAPVPLDELEDHLREEIQWHSRAGSDGQFAFDMAARQIGKAASIKTEFTKIERNYMKRTMFILLGILAVLVGMAWVLPALAWFRDHHTMPVNNLLLLLLGLSIVAGGLGSAIYGLKKRKA